MSVLFALFLMSGQAAATPQAAIPATAVPAPAKKAAEKKVCRTEDAESGSHMSKRVCHTAAEWELVDDGVNLSDKQIQTSLPNAH